MDQQWLHPLCFASSMDSSMFCILLPIGELLLLLLLILLAPHISLCFGTRVGCFLDEQVSRTKPVTSYHVDNYFTVDSFKFTDYIMSHSAHSSLLGYETLSTSLPC